MAQKINISGIIGWDVLAVDIKKEFKTLKPNDEVDIEINSPGGSVFEGIEISNAIKSHKGKTNIVITGLAASMGSYIALSGDTVMAYDDASFMIHNASTIEWGDHRDMRKTANVLESLTSMLSKAYTNKTGQSNSEIRDLMNDETWLFGDEIKESGFVDGIIQTEKPEDKEDSVAYQKLVFSDSLKKLKEEETSKNDIASVAAYFKSQSPTGKSQEVAPEKINPVKKDKVMDLQAFLKENPSAQAEIDALTAIALKDQKEKASANVEKVGKILMSTEYGVALKTAGMKVLTGEKDYSSFEDLIAVVDEQKESQNTKITQDKQPEETPAGDSPTDQISEEKKAEAEMKKGAAKTAREIGA